ncbi:hypothetical protein NDU88_000617 [Pleurodeles waltl]|uniref:Uncharacterized protein n=1 Tax=Pleurodeles waltl TaxID=8319 RepID=A0AAV7VX53_PLEWA|nr:hypothetical protein NDU88_000617 [Pleurodeles waltl]
MTYRTVPIRHFRVSPLPGKRDGSEAGSLALPGKPLWFPGTARVKGETRRTKGESPSGKRRVAEPRKSPASRITRVYHLTGRKDEEGLGTSKRPSKETLRGECSRRTATTPATTLEGRG